MFNNGKPTYNSSPGLTKDTLGTDAVNVSPSPVRPVTMNTPPHVPIPMFPNSRKYSGPGKPFPETFPASLTPTNDFADLQLDKRLTIAAHSPSKTGSSPMLDNKGHTGGVHASGARTSSPMSSPGQFQTVLKQQQQHQQQQQPQSNQQLQQSPRQQQGSSARQNGQFSVHGQHASPQNLQNTSSGTGKVPGPVPGSEMSPIRPHENVIPERSPRRKTFSAPISEETYKRMTLKKINNLNMLDQFQQQKVVSGPVSQPAQQAQQAQQAQLQQAPQVVSQAQPSLRLKTHSLPAPKTLKLGSPQQQSPYSPQQQSPLKKQALREAADSAVTGSGPVSGPVSGPLSGAGISPGLSPGLGTQTMPSEINEAVKKEEQLRQIFEAVNVRKTAILNVNELQTALINSDRAHFSLSTVRVMIRLFDKTGKDGLDFREFYHLWTYISRWRSIFDQFAVSGDGVSISFDQYCSALKSLGYRMSPETISYMFNEFSQSSEKNIDQKLGIRSLKLDLFVESLIWLMKSTSSFKRYDVNKNGVAVFPFDDYVQQVMSFRALT